MFRVPMSSFSIMLAVRWRFQWTRQHCSSQVTENSSIRSSCLCR